MLSQPKSLPYNVPPPKPFGGCLTALRILGYAILAEILGSYTLFWFIYGPSPHVPYELYVMIGRWAPLTIPLSIFVTAIRAFCFPSDAEFKWIVVFSALKWLAMISAFLVFFVILDVLVCRYLRHRIRQASGISN